MYIHIHIFKTIRDTRSAYFKCLSTRNCFKYPFFVGHCKCSMDVFTFLINHPKIYLSTYSHWYTPIHQFLKFPEEIAN